MEIMEKVQELLAEVSGTKDIDPESRLQEDLSLDSLHMVMMLLALEERFDIVLDESDMNPSDLQTAGDTCALVRRYLDPVKQRETNGAAPSEKELT